MEKSFETRVAEAKNAVSSIAPQQAFALRDHGTVVFLDPRPADAIASSTGIIPGAHNVGLGDIVEGKLPAALNDRSIHVVTSCQAGPMGALAAHALIKLGFSSVNYVDGGTQGWLDAGYTTNR